MKGLACPLLSSCSIPALIFSQYQWWERLSWHQGLSLSQSFRSCPVYRCVLAAVAQALVNTTWTRSLVYDRKVTRGRNDHPVRRGRAQDESTLRWVKMGGRGWAGGCQYV